MGSIDKERSYCEVIGVIKYMYNRGYDYGNDNNYRKEQVPSDWRIVWKISFTSLFSCACYLWVEKKNTWKCAWCMICANDNVLINETKAYINVKLQR